MGDYGRELEFGVFPEPVADPPERVERLVRAAEGAGLDLVGIQDHPYQRRFYDTWTLIAYLAARTRRVRFFPDVANLPLRPPAMLAKAAASLDVLSRGRVELGLGAGSFWEAIEAMGGPRRSPGEPLRHRGQQHPCPFAPRSGRTVAPGWRSWSSGGLLPPGSTTAPCSVLVVLAAGRMLALG